MSRALLSSLALVASLSLAPALARADGPGVAATPPAASTTVWYGHQILLVDALSAAVLVAGAAGDSSLVAITGAGGLVLGGPSVHLAHDRPGTAFASLSIRAMLPVFGATIGYHAAGRCVERPSDSFQILGDCWMHGVAEAAAGGMIGLGLAAATDAFILSHEERKPPRPADGVQISSITPRVDPRSQSVSLHLGGAF